MKRVIFFTRWFRAFSRISVFFYYCTLRITVNPPSKCGGEVFWVKIPCRLKQSLEEETVPVIAHLKKKQNCEFEEGKKSVKRKVKLIVQTSLGRKALTQRKKYDHCGGWHNDG